MQTHSAEQLTRNMVAEALAAKVSLRQMNEPRGTNWEPLSNLNEPSHNAIKGLLFAVPISLLLWTMIGLLMWLVVR
jgi:hypothetical protein